jgi:hypothetical protein
MLGQKPGGPSERPDLPRVHHSHGDAGLVQGANQSPLEPAGRLEHDQGSVLAGEPRDEPTDRPGVMRQAQALTLRQQMNIEPPFADINTNKGLRLGEALGHSRPRMRACRPIDCSA